MTQAQAKQYAFHNFTFDLKNHSCEIVKGEPICMGYNKTYAALGKAPTEKTCNSTRFGEAALQAPNFCVAGHTETLCSACQQGLTRLHTGRCCDPDPTAELGMTRWLMYGCMYPAVAALVLKGANDVKGKGAIGAVGIFIFFLQSLQIVGQELDCESIPAHCSFVHRQRYSIQMFMCMVDLNGIPHAKEIVAFFVELSRLDVVQARAPSASPARPPPHHRLSPPSV